MINPKVSVLIPVYNRVGMISSCVDSALSQDYPNLEVIISDNCSTDGTWELCCRSYRDYPNVILIRNPSNIGPVPNWLAAARAASGQYAKILFSDDLLLHGCICALVAQLDADTGFAYSAALIGPSLEASKVAYAGQGLLKGSIQRTPSFRGLMRYALFAGSRIPVSPGAALFRTCDVISSLSRSIDNPSSLESVNTGAGPDVRLFLDALVAYPYYSQINEPLCFFRAHDGSFSVGSHRASVRTGYDSALTQFFQGKYASYRILYDIARARRFFLSLLRAVWSFLRKP